MNRFLLPTATFLLLSSAAFAQSSSSDDTAPIDPDLVGGPPAAPAAPGGPGGGGGGYPNNYESETLERLEVKEDLTPYGVDLLGERLDLATGSLSFEHLDVAIPGNSGLEVAIRRSLRISGDLRTKHVKAFGDWSLDIPSLSMKVAAIDAWHDDRCSSASMPEDVYYGGKYYRAHQFWNGLHLNIPGRGSQRVFDSPQGPFVSAAIEKGTNAYWKIECLPSILNGTGEGFVATSPDGVTYTFNRLAYEDASWVGQLDRDTAYMLATRVEDRHGNTVTYSYSGNAFNTKLDSITATDASGGDSRTISITYTGDEITSISTGGRTWTYSYTNGRLTRVTLPSGLYWDIQVTNLVNANLRLGLKLVCGGAMSTRTGYIVHPYGARGDYTVNEVSHGRTEVPYQFVSQGGTGAQGDCIGENVRTQRSYDTVSLTQKTLTGPGLPSMTWSYTYSQTQGGWTTSTGVSDINTTTIVDPEGNKVVHHFDRSYTWMENAEVKTEYFDGTTSLLRTVEQSYVVGPMLGGAIGTGDNDKPARYPRSVSQRVITESADTYTTDFTHNYASTCYDYASSNACYSYGKPTAIAESKSFTNPNQTTQTKTTQQYYLTEQDDWMLALPVKTVVGSETPAESVYDLTNYLATALKRFGVTIATRDYLANGLLSWEEDAAGHRYAFSNYYRGYPQTITYPDLLTRQYTIDYFGNVDDATDRAGNVWDYDYDNLDRLTLIDYPDDPGLVRANRTLSYATVTTTDINQAGSGLVSGQWKQIKTRGTYRETRYLDALLRPVLIRTEDTTDPNLTRFARTTYDSQRAVFASFPAADAAAADGTNSTFDGLGRIKTAAENVTPFATTSYAYLAHNKTQVTNPRGKVTTTTYFALGSPDKSLPTKIEQPEGVTTDIQRNAFGEMTEATQSGGLPFVTATRNYYYDSQHNLCRQVDPETGSTAVSYNDDGELEWYAKAASGSQTACDLAAVQTSEKIAHTHNNLGQLTNVNYPDSSPDLTYGYDDNGNLTSLVNSDTSWTYTHNAVDSLDSETLVTNGQTFALSYRFDPMDRLDQVTYPGSTVVSITPNAYGEPESVGSYAIDIEYWPNGSIKELDYGTHQGAGRKYTTTRNARQLPENLKVMLGAATLADLTHSYDANANITSITDAVHGTGFDRSMGYDDLDRLETAAGFWGSGSYTFDALGNILTKTESGIDLDYTYNATTNLLTSVDDSYDNADYAFSYDSVGNVTHNGDQGFTYNLAGNMVSSTNPGITYKYDGHKRRVQKDDGSQISYTVYGQNGRLLHKLKGGVSTHYVYAGSLLIAELQGSTVNYVHTDLLGSPIKGDNGTAYAEHYRPWGEKKDHPIQLADDVGYTGHQSDIATGLTYMQARYYDPVVGRFMAVDPIGFGMGNPSSFNRFSYVNNNPFRYSDPTGMSAHDEAVSRSNEECRKDSSCTVVNPSQTDSSIGYEGNPEHFSTSPWPAALAASGALAVNDATGIGVVDDVLIPGIIAGALAYDLTQRGYVTYTLHHPDGRTYAGRASGFGTPRQIMMQRYYGHHMRLAGFESPRLDRYAQGIPGRAAIRGREQQLIDSLGGVDSINVGNRIRGVAKWNPFGPTYHKASDGYFGPLAPYTGY